MSFEDRIAKIDKDLADIEELRSLFGESEDLPELYREKTRNKEESLLARKKNLEFVRDMESAKANEFASEEYKKAVDRLNEFMEGEIDFKKFRLADLREMILVLDDKRFSDEQRKQILRLA